jgi:hypothetical protein
MLSVAHCWRFALGTISNVPRGTIWCGLVKEQEDVPRGTNADLVQIWPYPEMKQPRKIRKSPSKILEVFHRQEFFEPRSTSAGNMLQSPCPASTCSHLALDPPGRFPQIARVLHMSNFCTHSAHPLV